MPVPARTPPMWRQLRDHYASQIQRGFYKPGDLLPSQATMCSLSGVSVATVRAAMDSLMADGYIVRTRGRGTHVAPAPPAHGAPAPLPAPPASASAALALLREACSYPALDREALAVMVHALWLHAETGRLPTGEQVQQAAGDLPAAQALADLAGWGFAGLVAAPQHAVAARP